MQERRFDGNEWLRTGSLILAKPLQRIKHVVHGFGTKNWGKNDFDTDPHLTGFRAVFLRQIHSDMIHVIKEGDLWDRKKKMAGDAAVTEMPGILLVIKTADCLPVLIADEKRAVVAAVHCGWRGTAKRILKKTIGLLIESFNCAPESMVAVFGPSISCDCYEVGEDVIRVFKKEGFSEVYFKQSRKKQGKYLLDLEGANRFQLTDTGLTPENITVIDLCTHCEDDLNSYRMEKEKAGRNFSFIGLNF